MTHAEYEERRSVLRLGSADAPTVTSPVALTLAGRLVVAIWSAVCWMVFVLRLVSP